MAFLGATEFQFELGWWSLRIGRAKAMTHGDMEIPARCRGAFSSSAILSRMVLVDWFFCYLLTVLHQKSRSFFPNFGWNRCPFDFLDEIHTDSFQSLVGYLSRLISLFILPVFVHDCMFLSYFVVVMRIWLFIFSL